MSRRQLFLFVFSHAIAVVACVLRRQMPMFLPGMVRSSGWTQQIVTQTVSIRVLRPKEHRSLNDATGAATEISRRRKLPHASQRFMWQRSVGAQPFDFTATTF
jgi:hypothetical protein